MGIKTTQIMVTTRRPTTTDTGMSVKICYPWKRPTGKL
jgi:hypothetical protein